MTKTQRAMLVVLAAACVFIMSGAAHGQGVPAPGWQCMPYAGAANYTVDECTAAGPVFVYAGTNGAYFIITLPNATDACFAGHEPFTGVELGAQLVTGVGANTLRGAGLTLDAIPGAPADQACLDSLRQPWPTGTLDMTYLDASHLLLTFTAVAPLADAR